MAFRECFGTDQAFEQFGVVLNDADANELFLGNGWLLPDLCQVLVVHIAPAHVRLADPMAIHVVRDQLLPRWNLFRADVAWDARRSHRRFVNRAKETARHGGAVWIGVESAAGNVGWCGCSGNVGLLGQKLLKPNRRMVAATAAAEKLASASQELTTCNDAC